MIIYFFFFFVKPKTAYEMRISDWSSDVCSSDLGSKAGDALALAQPHLGPRKRPAHRAKVDLAAPGVKRKGRLAVRPAQRWPAPGSSPSARPARREAANRKVDVSGKTQTAR